MAMTITLSAIPSVVVAAAMVLVYGKGAVDAFGMLGAGAIVAAALAVVLLPIAMFVSYVLRFVPLVYRGRVEALSA